MMETEPNEKPEVYAIVRFDSFLGSDAPLSEVVTVKGVVYSREVGEAEVARLNSAATSGRVEYVLQQTRVLGDRRGATN